ncbi:MAG: CBS domain-containing protein [Phycisphaerae bacterium]|nr:CBS domain-containing protein [Phycisphaerae bacterium]
MQVKDAMNPHVETVDASARLNAVAAKMSSLDVGILPVKESGKIVGAVTDRDIVVRALAHKLDINIATASDIMSPGCIGCYDDDDLCQAANIMEKNRIHRLLVVDHDEKPVGVISIGDISRSANEHFCYEVLEKLSKHIYG